MTPGHETCHHGAYRMNCDEYEALLRRSQGRCEICGIARRDAPTGQLYIDHDGKYGYPAVRGIVCPKCNSLLRYVDRYQKPATPEVRKYLGDPWFVVLLASRMPRRPKRDRPQEQ